MQLFTQTRGSHATSVHVALTGTAQPEVSRILSITLDVRVTVAQPADLERLLKPSRRFLTISLWIFIVTVRFG